MLFGVKILLQGLLNSNSHGNGHTDHIVVECEFRFTLGTEIRDYQIKDQAVAFSWHHTLLG